MEQNTENQINLQTVAARLRAVRDNKELTRKEVSEKTGIPYTALEKYETGNQDPKIGRLNILADLYEVSVQELLGFEFTLQAENEPVETSVKILEKHSHPGFNKKDEKKAPTLRNVTQPVNVTEKASHKENEAFPHHDMPRNETAQALLNQLDIMRKDRFETGQRMTFSLVDRIHLKLAELEPNQLEELAKERNLFCETPEEGFNFYSLFNENPAEAEKLFKGNIAERIIDTAFFGIDLFAIDRDDLTNVADEFQDDHDIAAPAWGGFSWGGYEQFIPLIRPVLRNMALLRKGYDFTNRKIFSAREIEEY